MNKIFNPKRAGNYFVHELSGIKNEYLSVLLVVGLMPVIFFAFAQMFSLIGGNGFGEMGPSARFTALAVSTLILAITFPIKYYGRLTDKRFGSDYLMLPASSLEKWLSMVLVCCVALPAAFLLLFLGSDYLLSVIFLKSYPDPLLEGGLLGGSGMTGGDFPIELNFSGILYTNLCENLLIFTLGAVVFKKGKFSKTLLCIMAVGIIISIISVALFGTAHIDTGQLQALFNESNPKYFARIINSIIAVLYVIIFLILGGGLYWWIKTLKH